MKFSKRSISKLVFISLISVGITVLSSANISAQGKEKEEKLDPKVAKQAKITLEEARTIALQTRPGKVEDEELEMENDVLMYSFDIRDNDGKLFEVEIDAKTSKILSNKEDSGKEDKDADQDGDDGKPNTVSKAKNGTVNGVKSVGRNIKHIVGKIFKK